MQAGRHLSSTRQAPLQHLSSTFRAPRGPNRHFLGVISVRVCFFLHRDLQSRHAGRQAGTSPAPLQHLSSTSPWHLSLRCSKTGCRKVQKVTTPDTRSAVFSRMYAAIVHGSACMRREASGRTKRCVFTFGLRFRCSIRTCFTIRLFARVRLHAYMLFVLKCCVLRTKRHFCMQKSHFGECFNQCFRSAAPAGGGGLGEGGKGLPLELQS